MNVFPQQVVEVHKKKNLVMKILDLVMDFMIVLAMVVVDGVLILISMVVDGVLIFIISMEEDVDVIVMCILMMKMKLVMNMMTASMIMKILLHTMGGLDSTMIVVEVLVMMKDIIEVVTIGMIQTALLESS